MCVCSMSICHHLSSLYDDFGICTSSYSCLSSFVDPQMIVPIVFSIFVNTAVIVAAAELAFGTHAGLTDFIDYLSENTKSKYRHIIKLLWGLALFSSSQSSCATATYTGEVSHVDRMHSRTCRQPFLLVACRARILRKANIYIIYVLFLIAHHDGTFKC